MSEDKEMKGKTVFTREEIKKMLENNKIVLRKLKLKPNENK